MQTLRTYQTHRYYRRPTFRQFPCYLPYCPRQDQAIYRKIHRWQIPGLLLLIQSQVHDFVQYIGTWASISPIPC